MNGLALRGLLLGLAMTLPNLASAVPFELVSQSRSVEADARVDIPVYYPDDGSVFDSSFGPSESAEAPDAAPWNADLEVEFVADEDFFDGFGLGEPLVAEGAMLTARGRHGSQIDASRLAFEGAASIAYNDNSFNPDDAFASSEYVVDFDVGASTEVLLSGDAEGYGAVILAREDGGFLAEPLLGGPGTFSEAYVLGPGRYSLWTRTEAYGYDAFGGSAEHSVSVELRVVPEPAAGLLIAVGLLLFGGGAVARGGPAG